MFNHKPCNIHQAVIQIILFTTEMLPPTISAKWEMSDGFQKCSQPNAIIMHDAVSVSFTRPAQDAFQAWMRSHLLFVISIDVSKLRQGGCFLMWLTQGQTAGTTSQIFWVENNFFFCEFLYQILLEKYLVGKCMFRNLDPSIFTYLFIYLLKKGFFGCLWQNIESQLLKWSPVAIEKMAFHMPLSLPYVPMLLLREQQLLPIEVQ